MGIRCWWFLTSPIVQLYTVVKTRTSELKIQVSILVLIVSSVGKSNANKCLHKILQHELSSTASTHSHQKSPVQLDFTDQLLFWRKMQKARPNQMHVLTQTTDVLRARYYRLNVTEMKLHTRFIRSTARPTSYNVWSLLVGCWADVNISTTQTYFYGTLEAWMS